MALSFVVGADHNNFASYLQVPNKRGVPNKQGGRKNSKNFITREPKINGEGVGIWEIVLNDCKVMQRTQQVVRKYKTRIHTERCYFP